MSIAPSFGARASSTRLPPVRRSRKYLLSVPAFFAAAVCAYLVFAWSQGRARPAWLVNGLDREYDVAVNGKTYHLAARDALLIKLDEGDVEVASVSASVP